MRKPHIPLTVLFRESHRSGKDLTARVPAETLSGNHPQQPLPDRTFRFYVGSANSLSPFRPDYKFPPGCRGVSLETRTFYLSNVSPSHERKRFRRLSPRVHQIGPEMMLDRKEQELPLNSFQVKARLGYWRVVRHIIGISVHICRIAGRQRRVLPFSRKRQMLMEPHMKRGHFQRSNQGFPYSGDFWGEKVSKTRAYFRDEISIRAGMS